MHESIICWSDTSIILWFNFENLIQNGFLGYLFFGVLSHRFVDIGNNVMVEALT